MRGYGTSTTGWVVVSWMSTVARKAKRAWRYEGSMFNLCCLQLRNCDWISIPNVEPFQTLIYKVKVSSEFYGGELKSPVIPFRSFLVYFWVKVRVIM